jgi:hypothetical protein
MPYAKPMAAVEVADTACEDAEAFIPAPLPLCVTPTIWLTVEPLKLVGPWLTAPLVPPVAGAGLFVDAKAA